MSPYKIKLKFIHNKINFKFTDVLNVTYKINLKFVSYKIKLKFVSHKIKLSYVS